MSEQIKRVNRELKFKGTIIDFYQDTMEINGDHTVVWDFIKHKGAAAVVRGLNVLLGNWKKKQVIKVRNWNG